MMWNSFESNAYEAGEKMRDVLCKLGGLGRWRWRELDRQKMPPSIPKPAAATTTSCVDVACT